jgi:hypothetical protein
MAESEISELANEDDPLLPLPVSMKSPVVNEGTPYNNQFDVMINEAGNYRPIGDRVADKATLTKSTVHAVYLPKWGVSSILLQHTIGHLC